MDKLDKILLPSLAKKGLQKTARSAMVCYYADEWGKGRFKAISFSNGVLKLSTKSSAQGAEIDMQKDELIEFLQKEHNIRVSKVHVVLK